MTRLTIPQLSVRADMLKAALAYADAGWFVGPAQLGTKNPGSVLGADWQQQTSRDHAQIAAWLAGTSHGIFLHVGRSRALVFDVDSAGHLHGDIRRAIDELSPPFQSTRCDDLERGHYVFGLPPGRVFGNGVGALGNGWGEVRGLNGVIMTAPSRHEDHQHGGSYRWVRPGLVPELPDYLAKQLPDPIVAAVPAIDAEVDRFLAEHTGGPRTDLIDSHAHAFADSTRGGESRHGMMTGHLTGAMKEARAGLLPARLAVDLLEGLFLDAVGRRPVGKQGTARTGTVARDEWRSMLRWAVAQARAADVAETLANVVPAVTVLHQDDEFWDARPELTLIHRSARAALVSPWALFGAVLAQLVAAVPPFVVLPDLVGTQASLNLFVALVGAPGGGKGAAMSLAGELLDADGVLVASIGSGEGLAHLYAKRGKNGIERVAYNVLLDVAEVDTLAALTARQGATLLPELRKAWMGERIGFAYADPSKRLPIKRHDYRLSMVVGVQPARARALLDDADGGTPQRFLWLPTTDPDVPDLDTPRPVERLSWRPVDVAPIEAGMNGRHEMSVPAFVSQQIRAAARARLRGTGQALDGHALLARLKVAAALALLGKRRAISAEDWRLSGIVMTVSDATRAGVVDTLAASSRTSNAARGRAEGERAAMVAEAVDAQRVSRVARRASIILQQCGDWMRHRDLSRAVAARDRDAMADALERLRAAGQIEVDMSEPDRPSYRAIGPRK